MSTIRARDLAKTYRISEKQPGLAGTLRHLVNRRHRQVVAVDRIGVVGQVRLVWAALSPAVRARAQVVLMEAPGPDASTASNRALLGEYIEPQRIHAFPRLRSGELRKFGGTRTEEACGGIARGLGAATGS